MSTTGISEYAGLRRELEIGIRIAPTRATAQAAAKSIGAYLADDEHVAVRLAGLGADETRVHITLAICLGTVEEIKTADPTSRAALTLISRLIESFSSYDPSFVTLPHPTSAEARLAVQAVLRADHAAVDVPEVVHLLVSAA